MDKLKFKRLVKPFCYNEIEKELESHLWRLPKVDEVVKIPEQLDSKYNMIFVDEPCDYDNSAYCWDRSREELIAINKLFKINTIIVELSNKELCEKCVNKYSDTCTKCSLAYPNLFKQV